jgi:hypothetical protein
LFTETACFYNLYFISDKLFLSSPLALHIEIYHESSIWGEEFILKMMETYWNAAGDTASVDDLHELIKSMKMIKKVKHKGKPELLMINQYNSLLIKFKQELIVDLENKFQGVCVFGWVDLFDRKTVIALNYVHYEAEKDTTKEDPLIKRISDEFLDDENKKKFYLLLPKFVQLKKEFSVAKENNRFEGDPDFYSFPLYQIPLLPSLSKETMQLIRGELLRKAQPFTGMLSEFKSTMQNKVFGEQVKELATEFYKKIKPETEMFQQSIDKQIYFQQAINAVGNFVYYSLNVGIASVATIIDYYRESNILLPFVYEALKKNLSLHMDMNSCDVFFYLTEVEPANDNKE